MRSISDLHPYQLKAANHQVQQPKNFLWLFMGAGKTVVTLTSISHLIKHGAIRAALVIAPLRVAQTVWEQEARKWSHTQHLTFSLITGNAQARMRAIAKKADVYVVNYEQIQWLSVQLHHYYVRRNTLLPFDMLVLDESSKMKNTDTKRMEAIAPLLPYFTYRTGLTGTPASNGLEDLFGQFLVVDNGERLGTSQTHFINTFFSKEGHNGYKHRVTSEGERYIHQAVADIVLEMKREDYITLPDFMINDVYVELETKHRKQYNKLEQQLFTSLDNGEELEVLNEAAKVNKCLQFSNGAAYTDTETRAWAPVHDAKLKALEDIMEESGGEPVLLAYNYRIDAIRIQEKFPYARNITGMSSNEFLKTIEDWKSGEVRLLMGHPASMGHGVDGLQDRGCTMVWFGLNWSLELYLQFNSRLHRQGQKQPVVCHRILTADTMDDVVREALTYKTHTQENLRAAVDAYRRKKNL